VRLSVTVVDGHLHIDVHGELAPQFTHVLEVRDARLDDVAGDTYREGTLWRQRYDARHTPVGAPEAIAHSRRRLLDTAAQHSCLTCNKVDCGARPRLHEGLTLPVDAAVDTERA